jgi:catechol 2,3-dioxygenase
MTDDRTEAAADARPVEHAFGIQPPAYRLPPGTHVGPVALQVSDLDHSIGYYERVIGLRVLERDGPDATLGPQGDDRVLVRLHARPGLRHLRRRGALGLYHFAILLPDRPALGRFLGHLQMTGQPVGTADHAVSESVYLTDPDGLGIEVYADRPRESWRVEADGQLFMTTVPLRIGSLLDEAGSERWAGAPAGTVMGHVHLHVGDLDEAARFYHNGLGFDKIVWGYPGALFFSAGGYHHHLGTNTWAPGPPAADDQARLLSWDLTLPHPDDPAAAARSLKAAGYDPFETDTGWMAADPWGTRVRLISDDVSGSR